MTDLEILLEYVSHQWLPPEVKQAVDRLAVKRIPSGWPSDMALVERDGIPMLVPIDSLNLGQDE